MHVCLYDGSEIVSNISTIRARVSRKANDDNPTEDWKFSPNSDTSWIEKQPVLLIRSRRFDPSNNNIYLLIELSQTCELESNQKIFSIGCGSVMVPLTECRTSLIKNSTSYNIPLSGGHFNESDILLDARYRDLQTSGIKGNRDQKKRARVRFSLESINPQNELIYGCLPRRSMVVPLNLIKILAIYRNELADKLRKRYYQGVLSSQPLDSIFLSTFYQALEQLDLIDTLNAIHESRKKWNIQEETKWLIRDYELYIYPLLFCSKLQPYDLYDRDIREERREVIIDMLDVLMPSESSTQDDIIDALLSADLTEYWKPFTTNETCFALQNYL